MIALITAIVVLISTVVAWTLNPRRRLYAELDRVYKELDDAYLRRDKALKKMDNNALTIAAVDIMRLCKRKAVLLQRLGSNPDR